MPTYFFVTDLHGEVARYQKLYSRIERDRPQAVFLGGDLLPPPLAVSTNAVDPDSFVEHFLIAAFSQIRNRLGDAYPAVFLIPGNDDPRSQAEVLQKAAEQGIWQYVHGKTASTREGFPVYGYAMVPPTPFLLKDWERYDVSRYVPPGSVSPEEGYRSVPCAESEVKWRTIQRDLADLTGENSLDRAIFLFHTPPYDTALDRAALDGRLYESVPIDVHVGSIAVERFIARRQPLLTLHGHVHEAARLSGEWKIQLGRTVAINGAHDGPELALVSFDPNAAGEATRELL